jgi:hypothetical protein
VQVTPLTVADQSGPLVQVTLTFFHLQRVMCL